MNNSKESQDRTRNTTLAATSNTYSCNNTTFSSQRPQRIDKEIILTRLNFETFYQYFIPSLKVISKEKAKGVCPFHDDHNPSLNIYLEKGRYKCWACGAGGDVFKFYQDFKQVDFKTALNEIAGIFGISANFKDDNRIPKIIQKKRKEASLKKDYDTFARKFRIALCGHIRRAEDLMSQLKTEEVVNSCAWLYHEISKWEFWLVVLDSNDTYSKYKLFKKFGGIYE